MAKVLSNFRQYDFLHGDPSKMDGAARLIGSP